MLEIPWLSEDSYEFPPIDSAMTEPNGLLAAGGDLSAERLIAAYKQGIFPWYEEDQPILWWCPSPRSVLFPAELKISKSLAKTLRQNRFDVRVDTCFEDVIRHCAAPREEGGGTWITEDMIQAYCHLHRLGVAHSVETWQNGELVGGLYGISIGCIFFGESMFSTRANASKVAFVHIVRHLHEAGFPIIDCQVANPHLESLGATDIPLRYFKQIVNAHIYEEPGETWLAK
ncbi:MAG: leucyl/phenylalanyl-tRNA--protein transferase [Gammaproteobacteria bacterium]|nr:leucyl/phenylalanyl-tRNA--protein transferase [Gammaproteobacteria bacterium]